MERQHSRLEDRVAAVRAFNRCYTGVIGLLREGLVGRPHSPAESRVIFELAQQDVTEVVALRAELSMDAGYLSRILSRLEADGLARRETSAVDARRQAVRLTAAGRAAFAVLDQRSAEEVRALLSTLGHDEQVKLVAAMDTVRELLAGSPRPEPFVLRAPEPGDFGWVVQAHGVLYAREYDWDGSFEALVARIVADYVEQADLKREAAWIAEVDGRQVGCVFCVRKDEDTAQLRLLLVDPGVRGMGVGSRLVEECVRFARRKGYRKMVLWTNDVLSAARRIYERAGFTLVEQDRHHSFGHDLVGQNWELDLT
jgi:DNA-binding MarR family transcriptional regulator/GNAT superfamily N-acetyltransferase